MNDKIKVEKVVHKMWEEWERLPEETKKQFSHKEGWVRKWQYFYTSQKGKISLITLIDYFQKGDVHEIYCIDGKLFVDVLRFNTQEEAENYIEKMLT